MNFEVNTREMPFQLTCKLVTTRKLKKAKNKKKIDRFEPNLCVIVSKNSGLASAGWTYDLNR